MISMIDSADLLIPSEIEIGNGNCASVYTYIRVTRIKNKNTAYSLNPENFQVRPIIF